MTEVFSGEAPSKMDRIAARVAGSGAMAAPSPALHLIGLPSDCLKAVMRYLSRPDLLRLRATDVSFMHRFSDMIALQRRSLVVNITHVGRAACERAKAEGTPVEETAQLSDKELALSSEARRLAGAPRS